ncbi:hypothetical protein FN846DRAFT_904050 [Sphaerosporella brunnea]|uniref:Uncharacterized protein n=1 Tax=Sphaerosporella brunnea TaxID=1250544 RepID=A0A5J5F5J3_9PEZI|nr:hypothetical protein FN846DRAFT_904050 [Sphaerosporella brunnea]
MYSDTAVHSRPSGHLSTKFYDGDSHLLYEELEFDTSMHITVRPLSAHDSSIASEASSLSPAVITDPSSSISSETVSPCTSKDGGVDRLSNGTSASQRSSKTEAQSGSKINTLNLPYRDYLHKLPHTQYTRMASGGVCIACDGPAARYKCSRCTLLLCRGCKDIMPRVGGDMLRLISRVARWKLGYSKKYLQEEPLLVSVIPAGDNWGRRGFHRLRWATYNSDLEDEGGGREEDDGWSTDDTTMDDLIAEWNSGVRWEGFADDLSDSSEDETQDGTDMRQKYEDNSSTVELTEIEALEGLV